MILVDTNVFSELIKPVPNDRVVEWLFTNRNATLLSSIVVAEIDVGIRTTSGAAKRRLLASWFERLIERHKGRIVDFDTKAARCWAQLGAATMIADGRFGSRGFDTLMAAQALSLGVPFATRNVRHFEGVGLTIIDPWQT